MSPDEARRARASSFVIDRFAVLAIIGRLRFAHPTLLAATVIAAALGGCLVYGWSSGAESPAVARAAASAGTKPEALATPAAPVAPAAIVVPVHVAASAPAAPVGETLSARVDRLGRSPDPVDAFAAYKLVTACLWARNHEAWMDSHVAPGDRALLPTTQSACGDIASDQIQSRLRWLERAALAGVHHAATEMAREGPDGLGLAHDADAPQDAAFEERLAAARDAGVRTCDAESLESRENLYENGTGVAQDRARALAYWVATLDCRKRLDGAAGDVPGNGDAITQRMGTSLTADQIATAVAAGEQIARDARPLPGDQ